MDTTNLLYRTNIRRLSAAVLALIFILCAVPAAYAAAPEQPVLVRAGAIFGPAYRITVTGAAGASKVQAAIWTETGGKDDLVRYDAVRQQDGTWQAVVHTGRHGGGAMVAEAWVDGTPICSTLFTAPVPKGISVLAIRRMNSIFTIIASNVPDDVRTVHVPTWTPANGQDDLVWYEASRTANGVWSVTIDAARHGGGALVSHVYAGAKYVGSTSYTAPEAAPQVRTEYVEGTRYRVVAENLWGVKTVDVPTWGEWNGQDDLVWYHAENTSPGTWSAEINAAIHDEGAVTSQVYADDRPVEGTVQIQRSYLSISGVDWQGAASPDLAASSRTSTAYGIGPHKDSFGRPEEPIGYQNRYGSWGADFIGPNSSNIYLTFDEGYEAGYTARILDVLKEKDVKAVFFVTGDYVRECPDLVRRMIGEGHRVGSHSVHHPSFPTLADDRAMSEVLDLHRTLQTQFGYSMTLFRFPEGVFSERDLRLLDALGYQSVFWSFAYLDWDVSKQPGQSTAYSKLTNAMHPGAIYLLHAVSRDNAAVLGDFIDEGRRRGYTFTQYDLDR